MSILVTGAAGFIGFHTTLTLLRQRQRVFGIDNLNDYYDVGLKLKRLEQLQAFETFKFYQADVSDRAAIEAITAKVDDLTGIIHLGAQAGVRYSLENPYAYVDANVMGQVVMLEAARRVQGLRHFVYASSSSVYGANDELPFSVDHRVDRPISLYAATKRAGELMAYTYSHLYGMPTTGLRFFTVYGPWGRPDMAAFLFADAIAEGRPIRLFNHGHMRRDFTYVDDIVAGIIAALNRPPALNQGQVPHRLYNLGNSRTEELGHFVAVLEKLLGRAAVKELLPMQPGDVAATSADIEASRRDLGFEPKVTIEDGLERFVAWYREYRCL